MPNTPMRKQSGILQIQSPYRPAMGVDVALEHIQEESGNLYDSKVVNTCLQLFSEKEFQFD